MGPVVDLVITPFSKDWEFFSGIFKSFKNWNGIC